MSEANLWILLTVRSVACVLAVPSSLLSFGLEYLD